MQPTKGKSHEPLLSSTGHPLPRRTSPENSVTLRHHQFARDASLKASRGSAPPNQTNQDASSPRRASSGESNETAQSDVNKWFNQSNENPTATFDNNAMDVEPPFFQKESDSSFEDKLSPSQAPVPGSLSNARSSSAEDYRSVIDDLTVEIQKLKEELKRYKQHGPDMLRKDKLFEIKMHGLPKRKKRELEATLREFAAGLSGDSPETSSSRRNKMSSRHATRERMYSGSTSMSRSKHASSSSGSNARPVDSAYASMSTGAGSSGTSLNRPQGGSRFKSNDQKVENYLRDIPEGLYPRLVPMTEKEKKKLVVRRLEQIFTGKISGKHARRKQIGEPPPGSVPPPAQATPGQASPRRSSLVQLLTPKLSTHDSSNLISTLEPLREARFPPAELHSGQGGKKARSQDMGSASNSNEDRTESGGNGSGSGSGLGNGGPGPNPSPPMPPPPEQRPTRPRDLDPDRAQIPSENMEYIRHLGLIPPELLPNPPERSLDDVHPDEEGWVYLNLLCNMAQLHIMNVTPDFVRNAVVGLSAKFQLSPDGRRIRWRGGMDGTKFSSDSSGDLSQRSPETDETGNSERERRKRQKTGRSSGDSWSPANNLSKFGPQVLASTESFHYKPLFLHQQSPNGQSSPEDGTLSSFGPIEESNADSRWGQSGSGTSVRHKRRRDGAIIYYSGAPFCTDLSGDPGDISPATYMLSSSRDRVAPRAQFDRPIPIRTGSGSSIVRRPLSDADLDLGSISELEVDDGRLGVPELTTDSGDESSELNMEYPWSDAPQVLEVLPLEPCGLGGVLPEDHFLVVVTTRRSKLDAYEGQRSKLSDGTTEGIISRLAAMFTSSPRPFARRLLMKDEPPKIQIEYLSGRIRRLEPVPLPPPAIFFPPFSSDSSSEDESGSDGDDELNSSEELMSRRANPHQSDDYSDGVDLSSGDEDGEAPDDDAHLSGNAEPDSSGVDELPPRVLRRVSHGSRGSTEAIPGTLGGRSNSASAIAEGMLLAGGSSVATAGGIGSDYYHSSPGQSS
ncbi:frequency clock protein [Trichoderma citrinoviride]|uniref:Frequency clock protein n=1 Tax=Trichoderma citrinoviride TaxID=58853 RepID=A0A2T4AY40_9HYPO|nr:frequency clock protein [Trichoderma citrinoviride]PTB61979.1 frequency clock protein [Trichoderma citrinoviride]